MSGDVILCSGCRLLTIDAPDNRPHQLCPSCGGRRAIYYHRATHQPRPGARRNGGRGAAIAAGAMQQLFGWLWFAICIGVMIFAAVLAGLAGAL